MKPVVALGAVLAALLMVEGIVRLAAPAYNPSGRVAFTYLPDGTPVGPANAVRRQIKNTGDYDVLIRFNALGFRDPKPVGTSRGDSIFVVGDSFAFGWGVEESARFSDVLQARLGRPVFNIGEGSADFDGYGHLLRYAEAHGARIGTLIVSVCMENDLREYGPDEPERQAPGPVSVSAAKNFLTDHSAVYGLVATAIHRSPRLEQAAARAGLLVPNLAAIAQSDASDDAVASSAERFRLLVDGRRAVVLIVPSRALWAGTDEHRRQVARTHETFVGLLRQAGLQVVDVRAAFEQRGRPLGLHFPNDGHWTPEGHRVAGEELARAILVPTGAPAGGPGSASTSDRPPAR